MRLGDAVPSGRGRSFMAGIARCLMLLLFMKSMPLQATLLVQDSFDYGNESGLLSGFGGGSGFQGPWMDDSGMGNFSYVPVGLTFGTLVTAGGAAQVSEVSYVAPFLKAEITRQMNPGA